MPRDRRWIRWVTPIVAILTIAGFLQFYGLGDKSAWDDEAVTIAIASQPTIPEVLEAYAATERQPPLHHLLLHGWITVAGSSDLAARVPSAALTTATVPVLVWAGWRLIGPRTGLVAGLLLAVSPFALLYGRMARYYALTLFLSAISWALLIEIFTSHRSRRASLALWMGYAISLVLLLASSYPAIAVWAAQVLTVLVLTYWSRRQTPAESLGPRPAGVVSRLTAGDLRAWLVTNAVVLAVAIAWVLYERSRFAGFTPEPSPYLAQGLLALVLKLVFPLYDFTLGETLFPWSPFAIVGGIGWLAAIAAGVAWCLTRRNVALVAGSAFLIPWLATVAALSLLIQDLPFITTGSRAIAAFPFLLLIAAIGIVKARAPWGLAAGGLILAASLAGCLSYFRSEQFLNPVYAVPTREVAQLIEERADPDDLVIADRDINLERYLTPSDGPRFLRSVDTAAIEQALSAGDVPRVWHVAFGRDRTRDYPPANLSELLERYGTRVEQLGFVPQDPVYRLVKERLLGYPAYVYKLTVDVYLRAPRP